MAALQFYLRFAQCNQSREFFPNMKQLGQLLRHTLKLNAHDLTD